MVRFALVSPCPNFIEVAFEVFAAHNQLHADTDAEHYELVEVVVPQREAEAFRSIDVGADVYIARGLMAEILKTVQQEIPVAEIPVPATDLLRAIHACHRAHGPGKIGIIAASSTVMGASDLEDLLEEDLGTYPLGIHWNGPELVRQAVAEGCSAIVGGLDTCRYAQEIGVNNVFISTSRDSFQQGILAAKRAMTIRRTEQEKARRLQVILDASKDGILSLDAEQRVVMVNKSAERLLGISAATLGRPVADVPLAPELLRLLQADGECLNELAKCDGTLLMVSKHDVRVEDQVRSTVVTCQEVGGIQAIENKIRKKIYSKGHVAKASFEDIVGESPIMRRTLRTAVEYSHTSSSILLVGESGTGKELIAQSIHNASQRRHGPFVAVNCAAIPDSLLESELFGYAAGAFSGAHKGGKPGLFELAHNGSIFFDEIGEMPLHLQAKLLRAVQEREIIRLGGDSVIPVDIRIISATNQNLEKLVASGQFRLDLFFRLDVLRINIPRLDERREDIPALVEGYLRTNFSGTRMDEAAIDLLCAHTWLGNVRHLFNVCERLAVLACDSVITAEDVLAVLAVPPAFAAGPQTIRPASPAAAFSGVLSEPAAPSSNPTADEERRRIVEALAGCRYNRGQAAAQLGMDRSTLWRKMQRLGL